MLFSVCRQARRACVPPPPSQPWASRWTSLTGGAIAAAVAAVSVASSAGGDPLVPSLGASFFPIGVYYQPAVAGNTTSFAGWKARGVNTLIGYETQSGTVSIDQYSAAAVAAGMYMIRQPRANPAADATQQNLIGFLQPDEPDVNGIAPSVLQANYAAWKAAVPNMPVMANFDGSRVIGWQGNLTPQDYANYMKGADWASDDLYPVTGFINPAGITAVGQAVDKLRADAANPVTGQTKPSVAIIETSNQRLFVDSHPSWPERGVTPGEFREEVWDALIHGANAIVYFPQSFNAFHYDSTPIDVVAEMTHQDNVIESLAPVLNSSVTTDVSSVTLTGGSDGKGGGLESMVKSYNGVTYVFVLNQTNATVSATVSAPFANAEDWLDVVGENRILPPAWNTGTSEGFTDSFGPYAVHIYAEGPANVQPLTIPADNTPEPSSAILGLGAVTVTARLWRRPRRRRAAAR